MESKNNKEAKSQEPKTVSLDFGSFGTAKIKSIEVNSEALVYGKMAAD